MAKFCNKCGKPLVDGKCPDCENKREETEVVVTESDLGNELLDIIKNIWQKPIQTIKKHTEESNIAITLIILAISIVIGGLFTYFYTNSLFKGITSDVNSWLTSIAMLTGEDYSAATTTINTPFFSLFISGVLTATLGYVFFILLAKLFVGVIFKGKATLKEYASVISLASIFSTVATLISIIIGFISYKVASFIYLAGLIVFIVMVVQSFIDILKAKEDRLGYAVSLAIIFTYILVIIAVIIIMAILVASRQPVYY